MLTDKKLLKIENVLGKEFISDLDRLDASKLKSKIAESLGAVKLAEDELEANPAFQEIKESLKAVTVGLSEVKKRQKAIITYCLHLLEGSDE